jgi:arrestin-2
MMGLKFSKEMCLGFGQVYPGKSQANLTSLQDKLIKKLGNNAFPFFFELPSSAPTSVTLQPGSMDTGKPLGVEYDLKTWIAENKDEKPHRRSSVSMAIRKVQFAPPQKGSRQPSAVVSKGFALSSGKINLEVTLDKDIYYHGERISANVRVSNNSRKTVKCFMVSIVQHCEVTVVNAQFSREVASLQTKEGCPITPGASLTKQFFLTPVAGDNKKKEGIALDGRLKDEDANLASSTLLAPGDSGESGFGIIVSYTLRVRLNCGYLGGEIEADLPFKLLHPIPGSEADLKVKAEKKARKLESNRQMSRDTDDDDPNIVFEDFKRARSIDIAD